MAVSNRLEKVVNTYKLLSKNTTLNSAKIINVTSKNIFVQSVWNQKNLEKQTNQRFIQNHFLNKDFQPAVESFPIDITQELLSAISEDGLFKAILRSSTVDNKTKQYIEIWNKQNMIKNYDLAALDVHGDIYVETEFSTFEWSPDRTKLLYIAEKKLPKSEAFYKQKSLDKKNKEKKEKEEIIPGNEYIYKPDWGEQLVNKHHPVAVVLDIKTDSITILSEIPDQYSPGQLLWMKDSKSIIGVVWIHEPRHLGLVACTNRKSWIFSLNNVEFRLLTKDGCAVRAPKISPDGKYLVWLERSASGPHHNAHRLMYLDLECTQKEPIIITDIIDSVKTIHNEKLFYGIYGRLPQRCWSKDGRYLFYSTAQRTNIRSYVIDMKDKNMIEIQNDESSLTILDVKDDIIAFVQTSLLKPPTLYVGRLDPTQLKNGNITRVNITDSQKIDGFESLMYEHTIYEYDNDDDIKTFNFTYFGPKGGKDKSIPLIVVPHGGPHSNFVNAFSFDYSLLALMGMAVLQVNFRGSTGMGAKNVEFLQGKVGDVDVKDCVTATKEALNKYPWLSPSHVGVCGGSHGGFLVAHLTAQYPELYKVAVARNPVIDIAAMYTISDIPDCRNTLTVEEILAYQHNVCKAVINMYDPVVPSTVGVMEMFVKMYNSSPIILVDRVKAPTLICIGTNDLRVPSSQGKLWYNHLKANKVKTKMLVYEDNHQLGSGTAEMDSVINLCLWLMEHNSIDKEDNSVLPASLK
ncbi:acylamino-acid-releasing enzyme-like isoform X1 [Polistes fuscatus]|uniref:acylamino-acid-releasing enzyme-like isoform X1 n=1 Tax=Polistes fuscatus TaxID=30207 RepID=UPI001CA9679A|nr:acylamino-acid-releasing enzyme-like isoform X1 [Polistes fuscatus]XP_043497599.1 acylamino-acid-releasing enzyme-like isoform X1 [Polistes fuscatus]